MAELNKKYFGNLTGKFGDVVFRQRGSKNYVAQKPKSYSPPQTPEFLERTGKFKLSIRLASVINSIAELKVIWTPLVTGKLVFHHLVSLNYQAIETAGVNNQVKVSPDTGFGARLESAVPGGSSLTVNMHPLTVESGIDLSVEKEIQLAAAAVFADPNVEGLVPVHIFPLLSARTVFNLTDPLTFVVNFSTADADLTGSYNSKKFFCTLITFDAQYNPVKAAKTFSCIP